jgi:hypothetical protein
MHLVCTMPSWDKARVEDRDLEVLLLIHHLLTATSFSFVARCAPKRSCFVGFLFPFTPMIQRDCKFELCNMIGCIWPRDTDPHELGSGRLENTIDAQCG